MTTAPPSISLVMAHTPLTRKTDVTSLSTADLAAHLHDGTTIPVLSGADILAVFAHVIPYDLILLEAPLRDTSPKADAHPLASITLMVEAEDVVTYTLPALQNLAGKEKFDTISAFIKEGKTKKQTISRRLVSQAMLQEELPEKPTDVLEAAALLQPLLRLATTAVSHHHSLIFRYQTPPPASGSPWPSFLMAQRRPLLAANLFALLFTLFTWFDTGFQGVRETTAAFIFDAGLTYLLVAAGFMLPLWGVQLFLWGYTRQQGAVAAFIPPAQVGQIEEQARLRPFFFSIYPKTFTLGALYQPPPQTAVDLPKPSILYLAAAGLGLLLLFWLLPFFPQARYLAQFYLSSWLATLAFGISHLLAGQ